MNHQGYVNRNEGSFFLVRPVLLGPIQPIVQHVPRGRNIINCSTRNSNRYQWGYSLMIEKPTGSLEEIFSLCSRKDRENLLSYMTISGNLAELESLSSWNIPITDIGSKFLLRLFLNYNWDGWSPGSTSPISIEGIWGLSRMELKKFCSKYQPPIICKDTRKIDYFKCLVEQMAEDRAILPSEIKLVREELFQSLKLTKSAVLSMMPNKPDLKSITRIQISLEYVKLITKKQDSKISPSQLVRMGKNGWLKLANQQKIPIKDGLFSFPDLVRSLVETRRLDRKYLFLAETPFWNFYRNYYQYLPELSVLYNSLASMTLAGQAIYLYQFGILSYDLKPENLARLKSIKQINLIPGRFGEYVIPGIENIPFPRGILTCQSIVNHTDLTFSDLTKYIRKTDLLFYDAVNPPPVINHIPRSSLLDGPDSYMVNWIVPKGSLIYHYLGESEIDEILLHRGLQIPSTIEGKRYALAGLDKGSCIWSNNIVYNQCNLDKLNRMARAEIYYLAGYHKINLLNSRYSRMIIRLAIRLKLAGINPSEFSIHMPYYPTSEEKDPIIVDLKLPNFVSQSVVLQSALEIGLKQKGSGQLQEGVKQKIVSQHLQALELIFSGKTLSVSESEWKTLTAAKREISDLILYPIKIGIDLYLELRKLSRSNLILLIEILYSGNLNVILGSKYQHLVLLSRGYHLQMTNSNLVDRYKKLASLNSDQRNILLKIKDLPDDRLELAKLALRPSSTIDEYIINRDLPGLIEYLGIVIPAGVSENRYLMDHVQLYKLIIDRPKETKIPSRKDPETLSLGNLFYSTDQEIIQGTGIRPVFTDRMDLIRQVRRLWYTGGFFESIGRDSFNQETTLLTEVSDKKELMIGYGTLDSYQCYELLELSGAFYVGDDNRVHFRKPDCMKGEQTNRKEEFKPDEMLNLDLLIEDLFIRTIGDVNPELSNLHNIIEKGIKDYRQMNQEMRLVYQSIFDLSQSDSQIIKGWLLTLFQAGMYMRRWLGPGNPYPYSEKETLIQPDPANSKVKTPLDDKLGELKYIYSGLSTHLKSIIDKLHTISLDSNRRGELTLVKMFEFITTNQLCIRVASRYIVISTDYYLKSFFNHQIKGFLPEKVVKIS